MSESVSHFSASWCFVDRGRVAIALNRQLLEKPTANDALLLTTILSTDLGLLKKRGFNGEPCIQGNVLRSAICSGPDFKETHSSKYYKGRVGPKAQQRRAKDNRN